MLSLSYAIITVLGKACIPSEVLDGRKLMEHPSAKDAVLTLAGVSPGSGVLHQGF